MAFDEWMLSRVLSDRELFIVRLYTWRPAAITFGFNQRFETALDHSQLHGTPIIRRITGGRALYHDQSELTYSMALSVKMLTAVGQTPSMAESSSAVALALVRFLRSIGIESDYLRFSSPGNSQPNFFHKAPCFASHARYEIVAQTGKIVASAQRRYEDVLFQHGSIKLHGVSSHPAVPIAEDSEGLSDRPAPMAEAEFDRLGRHFIGTFQDLSETPYRQTAPVEQELLELQKCLQWVKKNATAKRDIFKHKHVTSSL